MQQEHNVNLQIPKKQRNVHQLITEKVQLLRPYHRMNLKLFKRLKD